MSHLLAISVGPVQEFIAAARRTRDLWFGSYLLSAISREVAKAVEGQNRKLIFPASWDTESVANVILVQLDVDNPKEVAAKAKEVARKRWREFAEQARGEVASIIPKDVWKDQVDDVVEFYAAWVPHTDLKNYRKDREHVMRLLDGRKNGRDFKQPCFNDLGLPKSSLDGQRPTVLVGPKPGESRETYRDNWPKRLRLSPGEQLDVVGVTKRLGKRQGESDARYPSVARVAAETWLRGLQGRDRDKLQRLNDACHRLVPKGLNAVREEQYQYFPYEGTIIYKDRHPDFKRELGLGEDELKEVAAALKDIGGEPNPYLAVLVADGDRMGKTISNLTSAAANRTFSQALARFAGDARQIVNAQSGVLVYAGGDDVLAFLPVNKCLACARQLHAKFSELLTDYGSPTLSVGIAIGHFMENLEDLLGYGRAAEKAAKEPDRNGLAVHLHKRGGAPNRIRATWDEKPDERLMQYARLMLADAIPSKLPYDLRKLADLYQDWKDRPPATVQQALQQDSLRVIRDKQPRAGRRHMPEIERTLQAVTDAAAVRRFAEELLIARQIAEALRQAGEVQS